MAFFVVRPVRTFLRSKRRLVPYDLRIAGERKIPICGYLAHGEKSLSLQRTKGYSIMHRLGKYTASDRMSDLVCGNYHILLIMSRFGIALGFGDRTVDEVCCQSGVDTATFLAVVNLLYDEGTTTVDCRNVSLEAFLRYLHNSHDYFLQYRLPDIRRKLSEAVACGRDGIAEAIIRFFDDYAAEVHKHMMYEEETVFPYVRQLLTGECPAGYDIETFHRQHDQIEAKLTELKNILIKYYPASESCGKEMNGVLFDIFLCESELASHNDLENRLFIPAVAEVERKIRDAR